jgi:hypothetical protein
MSNVTPNPFESNSLYERYGQFRPVPMYLFEQGGNLTADAKLVYIVLLSFKNDATGLCCPSYESLMERTSLSRVRVSQALNELVHFYWVGKRRKFSGVTHYMVGRPVNSDKQFIISPTLEAARQYVAMMKNRREVNRKRRAFKIVA